MASIFDLLRETLPIAAAEYAITDGGKVDFDDVDAGRANALLAALQPDEDYTAAVPAYKDWPDSKDQRLWAWTHLASDPAAIADVWCRVHNSGFGSRKVLDRLEWGWEDMQTGEFKRSISIVTMDGATIELPLTKEFVDSRFVIFDGYLPEDHSDLWKLEMRLDKGLVVAFVYEIDVEHNVHPWRARAAKNQAEADDWAAYKEALLDIPKHPEQAPEQCVTTVEVSPNLTKANEAAAGEPAPTATVETTCKSPWGGRIRRAELMPASAAAAQVAGQVPATECAAVDHMRVLVVLSFAVCRERADFEPGGIVGMARLYPHVLVKADVPLKKIEAAIRLDRPEKTETKDDGLPDKPKNCCLHYDEVDAYISSILVTDTNNPGQPHVSLGGHDAMPVLPFWSNMFAYYQPHAFQALGRVPMKMVRTDRRDERTDESGLVERDVVLRPSVLGKVKEIQKLPRQGEFDSIHMAPKLKLVGVTHVLVDDQMFPVDRAQLHLDDIPMAPFCAHDCFHLHWRWPTFATKKWALGWDETGPYKTVGAPLVPMNQDVCVWLRSPHQATYQATVGREDGSVDPLPACDWQIVAHHGAAYAVDVSSFMAWLAVELAFTELAPPPEFYQFAGGELPKLEKEVSLLSDAPLPMWNGAPVTIKDSTALFYWYARYKARLREDGTSGVELVERCTTDATRLWKARIL